MGLGLILMLNLLYKTDPPPTVEEKCGWQHTVEERCNHTLIDLRMAYTGCDDIGF